MHYTAGRHWSGKPANADRFLEAIPGIMSRMKACNVILYQAGADPHVDDPLGGWLTTAQLAKRDRLVFAMARRMGGPAPGDFSVGAGGGYGGIYCFALEP